MSKFTHQSLLCPDEKVTEEQLATDRRILAFDQSIGQLNRRGFMSAFAGAAALAALGGGTSAHAQTTTVSITDVLNFALNVEYLEANFYAYCVGTTGLSSTDMGGTTAGAVTGMPKVTLDAKTLQVASALALDELKHVELLRSAITTLGGTPIVQPAINLAANGAITTQAQFIATARQFTALGSSAYAGAAQFLASNPTVLQTAAQILGAEGQHAGTVNYLCIFNNITSAAMDTLDVPPTSTNYITAPMTAAGAALAPARTTAQVLGIAYGASTASTTTPTAGKTSGGFFPNGVNGTIKST